ncbi:MAG TPA: LLM class flavin-dependent oxidoreductase [Actinomycetota bacterium]|nr:LLM class flavin-dependent oxidoreductase [Actinomycetota bacterium]
MKIGVGLPNPVPSTPGQVLLDWARRAEERGFSSLATIDRIAYPSYESIIALTAAAAVTARIGLMTNVVLGPTRNPVLLAKEAASLDQISGGRFRLGLAVGARADDYEATGQDFATRGKRFDRDLEIMHAAWRGEPVEGAEHPVGPTPASGDRVPILMGGMADAAIRRTIQWAIGWTVGGAPPERGGPFAERVRAAWTEAGRHGDPVIVGLTYYGLGDDAEAKATEYLGSYYGDMGRQIAQWIPKTPEALRESVKKFEHFGFDELFLVPTQSDVAQVDRAADAVR